MIRSINSAENAMLLQQTKIDTLANNLANVNSSGFRQVLTRVTEQGSEGVENPDGAMDDAAGLNKLPRIDGQPDSWVQTNPLSISHVTDTRRGSYSTTGRDTDVAIMGRGFFAIQAPEGELFTRAGSFTLNSQKQLVTPDGLPVVGDGGPITIDGESFSIDNSGLVMVDGAQVGRLKIVDFADASKLEHKGNNLLQAPEDQAATAVPIGEIVVSQGQIEGSNVNAIDTLVAMISAQRAFEVQQKTLTTEDEMLSKSVNKLPQVGS